MANKPSPYKRHITMRVNIETCRAVEKKYRRPEDLSASIAFIRAFEDATRDVILTADDFIAIADEIKTNRSKIERKFGEVRYGN